MTRLFLLRHGSAEDRAEDDFSRELVERGREQARLVAAQLVRMEALPRVVLSSPLVRARQTAEVLLEALALEQPPPLVVEPLLAPGVAVAQMAMAVAAPRVESAGPGRGERQPRVEPILAVGHEPSLSRLAGHLCGAPELRLELKKGGLVEIELAERDPPRGALLGLLRPGHLR